jgi:hypothetical protein
MALAKGAIGGRLAFPLAKGALKIMAWSQAKTVVVGAIAVALAVLLVKQHNEALALREQNESLSRKLAQLQSENDQLSKKRSRTPRLPAPQMQATQSGTSSPLETLGRNSIYDRLKDTHPKLSRAQVEPYLKSNGRNADTLLAAYRTCGDAALLKEAMEKYPSDPHVAFEAIQDKSLSADQQRQWLTAFEKAAPDNALGNYLSALNYFNSGQADQAVQELSAASGKQLDDYTVGRVQDDAEAYLAAGYSMAESEQMASMQLLLPQLSQMKQLGIATMSLGNTYATSGDTTSAQAAYQMAASLGQQYATPSAGEPAISQLVGIWVERNALQSMDPNAPYGDNGQTVQDQINQLTQQRDAMSALDAQAEPLFPAVSDQDWIIYKDRWMMFGEQNAVQWVVNKYGQQK